MHCRTSLRTLVLYSREGCHLCEDMQATLKEFSQQMQFQTEVVDIDDDPALQRQYNAHVPLLMLGGREICRHFLDLASLQSALDARVQST